MKKHRIEKHPRINKGRKCTFCDLTLDENYELPNHIKAHKEAENIECNTCGKVLQIIQIKVGSFPAITSHIS